MTHVHPLPILQTTLPNPDFLSEAGTSLHKELLIIYLYVYLLQRYIKAEQEEHWCYMINIIKPHIDIDNRIKD